jgi:energy-coupling factor transporter transmembrane protein EcfT
MSARLTTTEFEQLAKVIKDLLAEHPILKVSVVVAGVGGACEILHTFWLAIRFVARF